MNISDLAPEDNLCKFCIPIGTAVSAKFRGAFCEALVNSVDRIILCRIQLVENKKTLKLKAEEIIGNISINTKVQVKTVNGISNAVILKIIDNSVYHVVFNDGDTGKLRRNQLVLKGDRHYKESESLDQHPLTNPEHFTKAVIYDKRMKDKSDLEDDEFDEDQKSCSQESLTTVSSNKTRRQILHNSSPSIGTGGSSLTTKTSDEAHKNTVNKINKFKKHANTKYVIGSLVMVNRVVKMLGCPSIDKGLRKTKSFVGLIVSPFSCEEESNPNLKGTQCVIKSFLDNFWYVVFKRDLELVVKRDMLIRHNESDSLTNSYVEKCLLFFDAKIYPDQWDSNKLLYSYYYPSGDDLDRSINKSTTKSRMHSSLTNSLSSLDSSSSDEGNRNNAKSDSSDQEYQDAKDEWVARFYGFWEDKGNPVNQGLEIQGTEVDIYQLYELVKDFGGFQKVITSVRWPHIYHLLKLPHSNSENYQRLQTLYKKFIYPYVDMKKKLGTFEQSRIRKQTEKLNSSSQKARPLLSARERREYGRQFNRKPVEARSVSSQSVCERPLDLGVSGDEIGTNSLIGDTSQLSQCSSSPKPMFDRTTEVYSECKSNPASSLTRLSPGTIVTVAYGDKKMYKAKILQQHSPESKSLKSPSSDSKNSAKPIRTSLDSLSNADSTSSVNNDFKSEQIDNSTFYKVHYIGWNSRHDEIISPERIIGVFSSDVSGIDNQSTCSSSCRQKPNISDSEQALESSNAVILNDSSFLNVSSIDADLVIDESTEPIIEIKRPPSIINSADPFLECENVFGRDEVNIVNDCSTSTTPGIDNLNELVSQEREDNPQSTATDSLQYLSKPNSLKRRRSRSVCFRDPGTYKRLITVQESRTIASLNLYRITDKMPTPPKRQKHQEAQNIAVNSNCGNQLKENPISTSYSNEFLEASYRQSHTSNNSATETIHCKSFKHEYISPEVDSDDTKDYFKQKLNRSPSFSNDSVSDASTVPFTYEHDQSLFYLSANEDSEISSLNTFFQGSKSMNRRGRKPVFRPDKKLSGSGRYTDHRIDIAEIESTSSQHSGSVHGRRVTRSLRATSDQNTVDDNSIQFEDDSQTSQDDNAFQLPTVVPMDVRSIASQASGTPTVSSQKGRRPKSRRKIRNSMSTSSADGGYQDSNGEASVMSMLMMGTNGDVGSMVTSSPKQHDTPGVHHHSGSGVHRPSGRSFQRLHPSLIPVGLDRLLPEERVKLLECVIRQTHLNFLDVKDKIKFVEKQILEIRASRANGHTIESDEDKFR